MKSLDRQAAEQTLLFDPLQDNSSIIHLIDRATGEKNSVEIAIDTSDFKHRIQQDFPSQIADIIDLAVAIHASDRLTKQDPSRPQIQLHVVLPIRHPEILNQSSLHQQLCELLEWATGKNGDLNLSYDLSQGVLLRSNHGFGIRNPRCPMWMKSCSGAGALMH